MKIYIKSFNRPYYLDRCIQSIVMNVIDQDLKIIVLDDGTDPKYLLKIIEKYPQITIKHSPFYEDKVKKIANYLKNGIPVREMEIPTQFWLSSIMESEDSYVIVFEDDMWFTNKIDITATVKLMELQKMCMLKLFYYGNNRLISGVSTKVSEEVNTVRPKVLIENPWLAKLIIQNPMRWFSRLQRMGLFHPLALINYYTIYYVAGAIFSKKYYNYIWKDFKGKVDEGRQLFNAVKFYYDNKKMTTYGFYNKDIVNTSYTSSATNMFKDIKLNVYNYNYLLNESWFEGTFNPMAGYPLDIEEQEIIKALENNPHKLTGVKEWYKWVDRFKGQYRSVGHSIG